MSNDSQRKTLIETARQLGEHIQANLAYQQYHQAVEALEADEQALKMLNDYQAHMDLMAQKQTNQQPIEVEDKQKMSELQKAVVTNEKLKAMQIAQMDYSELMREVDEAMNLAKPGKPK